MDQKKKQALRAVSVNVIDKENSIFSQPDGLKYFYEPKPGVFYRDSSNRPYQGEYTINNDSLNARRDYEIQKPKNIFRIITIGDSFTFGLYVNTKDNWTSLLEDKLNANYCGDSKKYEVINLGVEGYDSRYAVERFKKRGEKYSPDLVIWLHTDLYRVRELMIPLEEKFKMPVESTLNGSYSAWNNIYIQLLSQYGVERLLNYNKEAISSLRNYYHGKVIMATIPGRITSHGEVMLKSLVDDESSKWLYFKARDIYGLSANFGNDSHPNQKGHKIISEDMLNYIKNSKLISCN